MKKNFLLVVTMVATLISFLLIAERSRNNLFEKLKDIKRSIQLNNNAHFPIEEAGDPHADNPENTKMVSEGSLYGVNYYNRIKQ